MATKLKNLKVTSVDVVPAGANPDAHIRLFKSKDAPEMILTPNSAEQTGGFVRKILAAVAKLVGMPEEQIEKAAGDAETFGDTYADRVAAKQCAAACDEAWDMCYAMQQSVCSIMQNTDSDADSRTDALKQSLSEFDTAIAAAITSWAQGAPTGKIAKADLTEEGVALLKAQRVRIDAMLEKASPGNGAGMPGAAAGGAKTPGAETGKIEKKAGDKPAETGGDDPAKKGVVDTMKIDKSKMTPEEAAQFDAFEKKYGLPDDNPGAGVKKADAAWKCPDCGASNTGKFCPDCGAQKPAVKKSAASGDPGTETGGAAQAGLNPEVKKALEEVEVLKGQLAMQEQVGVAKKYEVLGKKPEELAKKLVDLKKAGGTAYADYVALLDEQVGFVEKSGIFGERGTGAEGSASAQDAVEKAADEVMKTDPKITKAAAIAKACEQHPELLAEYDKSYAGR